VRCRAHKETLADVPEPGTVAADACSTIRPGQAQFPGEICMEWDDYLRQQATMYRQLAEKAEDPVVKQELLELADVCEEVANDIEDHLTSG